jgi:hypothetical protein
MKAAQPRVTPRLRFPSQYAQRHIHDEVVG